MRVLGIDFGEQRIGLALSDPAGRMAVPLTTILRTSDRQAIQVIHAIVENEAVERLIVGEPRNLDGSPGAAVDRVRSFVRKLQAVISLPCDLVDETLTSVEAKERLRLAGVNVRRHPERVDAVAAQILVEQFLSVRRESNDD